MAKNHLENGRVDQTMVMDILYEIAFVPNQNTHTRQPSNPPPQQLVSRWAPPDFDGDRAVSRLAEISSRQASRSLSRSTVTSASTVSHKPSESTNTTVSQSVAESLPSLSSRSTSVVSHKPSETNKTSVDPPVIDPLPFVPVKSKAEHEAEKLDPIYVESARDVDNLFREMLPFFEGAESEQNWKHREQSTLKVRKVTKGNAYDDFPAAYLAGIKLLLNGLIGVAESLRTTQCTLGCHCIQDVARRTGPNLDPMVEILLQSLMKLCGQTKKISAANGDMSVTCIISQVSFNARLAQHIYLATQDKNVSPRLFACGWLMTILTKHGHHKSVIDHNGALESINKSITAGLMDRDASVRTRMRPTYWAFARLWNDRSERYYPVSPSCNVNLANTHASILLSLDKKQQQLLLKDASNPFPDTSSVAAALGEKAAELSKSTSAVPTRPSVKETMAKNRANRTIPTARPSSAGPSISPTRELPVHVATKSAIGGLAARRPLNTSTSGNLSSAPVRPIRNFRKPDIPRPATADPYSQRPKPDARSATPAARRPKTPVAPSTAKRGIFATKKPTSQPVSPTKIVQRRISWSDDLPGGSLVSGPSRRNSVDEQAIEDDSNSQPGKEVNNILTCATHSAPNPRTTPSPVNDKADAAEEVEEDVWLAISREASPTRSVADGPHDLDNVEMSTRISQSPRLIQGRKEILSPRKRPQLQVYEDPEAIPTDLSPMQSPTKSNVLSDLPINTPPLNPNHLLVAEETNNSTYHAKWKAFETSEQKNISSPTLAACMSSPIVARRLLESAIQKIRAGSYEFSVLRRVQHIIKEQDELLAKDSYLVDELLLTLLDAIEGPIDQSKQIQILLAIQGLLSKYPQQCSALYPKALCAVTLARAGHSSSQRIVSGLEATAEAIVDRCEPTQSIDAVLDLLDSDDLDLHSTCMGLYQLAGLLTKTVQSGHIPLSPLTEHRIGKLTARALDDHNIDVRHAAVELAVQFRPCVESEKRFWEHIPESTTDRKSLVTYYLQRNALVRG